MTSWSQLATHRRAIAKRWRTVYDLPTVRRGHALVASKIEANTKVLEVGAGDGRLQKRLPESTTYETMDVDPETNPTYTSLDAVDSTFDAVVAIEVVEHLEVEAIGPWLETLVSKLKPGGRLMLTTPNVFCPSVYLRDATHKTPLAYDELGGLVTAAGAEVEAMYRIDGDALLKRFVNRFVLGWVYRLMRLDHAQRIAVVARRSSD